MVPRGFAHGFATLTPNVNFMYKCCSNYNEEDAGIAFYDTGLCMIHGLIYQKRLF